MKPNTIGILAIVFVAATCVRAPPAASAEPAFFSIAAGWQAGQFFKASEAICRIVDKTRERHGVRCSSEITRGSTANINAVRDNETDAGMAQSDWQFHAYQGSDKFSENGPFETLRAVFSLHAEPLTIFARANEGIRSLEDLKGKRINVGPEGWSFQIGWSRLYELLGWDRLDFTFGHEKWKEQIFALCDRKTDAGIWWTWHPRSYLLDATTICDLSLVYLPDGAIERVLAEFPYYRAATIPGGLYKGSPEDIPSLGTAATLFSSTETPDEVVYEVVKAVFENLEELKHSHPAFAGLEDREMATTAQTAPLHPGAERYYRERGFLDK